MTIWHVTVPLPVKLFDSDKLLILQGLDKHREWCSLDDKRYCLVCEQIITGRGIQLIGGTRETGPLRAVCPTKDCRSIPMDWVPPTDEILQIAAESPQRNDQAQYPLQADAIGKGK